MTRLDLAAQVGSDVPLFLVGGTVLGSDRGQLVAPFPDLILGGKTEIPCVVALPDTGVSTPQAFRDWDRRFSLAPGECAPHLHKSAVRDTMEELSRTYASLFPLESVLAESGASGILPDPSPAARSESRPPDSPENLQARSREQLHPTSGFEIDLAENSLLALVRTGIENDFETVVFPQYPFLRDIKRHLMGFSTTAPAVYAALSGSGSALFGLYRSSADAEAAQQRLKNIGVKALVTTTLPRPLFFSSMFAK